MHPRAAPFRALLFGLLMLAAGHSMAASPDLINYQGVLTDLAGLPQVGTFDVTFSIYDEALPGSNPALWSETQSVTTNTEGRFTVLLGAVSSLDESVFSDQDRWLAIRVSPEPTDMSPRQRLTSVPFAHRVGTVDGASGGTITGELEVSGVENKMRFLYQSYADLPAPSTWHGMFAHVHGENAAYYAHSAQWVRLADSGHTHDASGIVGMPGIVSSRKPFTGPTSISSTASMQDLVVCTVITSADGQIYVSGRATVSFTADNGLDGVALQIDQSPFGSEDLNYSTRMLAQVSSSSSILEQSVFVDRVYSMTAGEHIFRLEGRQVGIPQTTPTYSTAFITAMFFPIDYGTVMPLADSKAQSDRVDNVAIMSRIDRLQREIETLRTQVATTVKK